MYDIWHRYKYCVHVIYRAILPFIKFLEQGTGLQVSSILRRKAKVIHMEKTLLGLLLSTPFNGAKLDGHVSSLLGNHEDFATILLKYVRLLLVLKSYMYTYSE